MVYVEFLGPISKDNIELEATSLQELSDILSKDEDVREWLSSSAVAVNDTLVSSLDTKLNSGDKVSILPPVCGG